MEAEKGELKQAMKDVQQEIKDVKEEIKDLKEEIKVLTGHPGNNGLPELEKLKILLHEKAVLAKKELLLLHERLTELAKKDTIMMQRQGGTSAQAGGTATVTKALEDVQLFWHALQSKSCLTADGRLELQDGAFLMGNKLHGSQMLVRHCYKTLYKRINELCQSGLHGFVVTGTPGIGKSYFKFPLMHWLVDEGKAQDLVVEMQGRRFLFSKGCDVLVGSTSAFEDKLCQRSTWWIVDMSKAFEREATTVLLSSPKRDNYKEFLKLRGSTMLYMNLWTDEEIHTCRAVCFPGLSDEKVDELQAKWGNIPRYVLEKAHDQAAQASLDDALAKCRLSAILDCIGAPDSADDASHKIVHLDVQPSQPEHMHCNKVTVMASAYVSRKLVERAALQHPAWLQPLINLANSEPALRAAIGALFEAYAHRRLQTGGHFKVRKLGFAEAAEPLQLPAGAPSRVFREVEEVAAEEDGVYCLPRRHNFPAVDALSQPSYLYQMTIAQKRSIHPQGLEKARSQLRMAPHRLYFCVPTALYPEFVAVRGIAADLEQWVLEVPGFD